MNANVFVSVIIPCFNADKYLSEVIESCLRQTYPDFEIICIDDGSTDNTGYILRSYLEKNPSKMKCFSTSNYGVSHARNLGTQNARGEWIQYLDADDLLSPDSLEKKVIAVKNNPNADVIYTNWQDLIDFGVGTRSGCEHLRTIQDIHPVAEIAILKGFWAPTAAYLYRANMVKAIGGWNLNLPIIQDARFVLDCALYKAHFVHVPETLCFYRTGHENALSRKRKEFAWDCYRNVEDIEAIWSKRGQLSDERLAAVLSAYLYVARSSYLVDADLFYQAVAAMKRLDLDFIRVAPRSLQIASRILGYEGAEFIAQKWSMLKRLFKHNSGRAF